MTNRERIERLRRELSCLYETNQLGSDIAALLALLDEWDEGLTFYAKTNSEGKRNFAAECLALLDAEGNPNG